MTLNRRTLLQAALVAALASTSSAFAAKPLVIGFSQVGAESEWRTANTVSIKDAAKKEGITLSSARKTRSRQSAPSSPSAWT
jgi:galactofuranose transport system substrate-binding protein